MGRHSASLSSILEIVGTLGFGIVALLAIWISYLLIRSMQ